MGNYFAEREKILSLLKKHQPQLEKTLITWCNCNSGSYHPEGLEKMAEVLKQAFSIFDTPVREIQIPAPHRSAKVLHLKKHPQAPIQILLGGHYDTVFARDSTFQSCTKISRGKLCGPGVADMKGGLLVLLTALKYLEQSPWAGQIGWEVLLTPDEEIGSVGSKPLWEEIALRVGAALLFEPALPSGNLVSTRKGSINLLVSARGKRAHAGRAIEEGCNAITPLLRLLLSIEQLHSPHISVNIGRIEGGETHNIVPEQASAKVNIRMLNSRDLESVRLHLQELLKQYQKQEHAQLDLYETSFRPPKESSENLKLLFEKYRECGQELGLDLAMQPSGGVCDGNFIAAQGVPVLDTLGVVGGNLHTEEEYIELKSLTSRTALTALFLIKLAQEKERFIPFIRNFKKETSAYG